MNQSITTKLFYKKYLYRLELVITRTSIQYYHLCWLGSTIPNIPNTKVVQFSSVTNIGIKVFVYFDDLSNELPIYQYMSSNIDLGGRCSITSITKPENDVTTQFLLDHPDTEIVTDTRFLIRAVHSGLSNDDFIRFKAWASHDCYKDKIEGIAKKQFYIADENTLLLCVLAFPGSRFKTKKLMPRSLIQ